MFDFCLSVGRNNRKVSRCEDKSKKPGQGGLLTFSAGAEKTANGVDARPAIVTGTVGTVVNVLVAVKPLVALVTLACEATKVVDTLSKTTWI